MSVTGTLIGESIRVGATLEDLPLRVERLFRRIAGDAGAGQPLTWLFLEFSAPEDRADDLARAISEILEPRFGWYCDFRSEHETFVVFAGRVFRYPRGDAAARRQVEQYARSVGVPADQVDWPA